MRRALPAAAVLAASALLVACGPVDGDGAAGTAVAPTATDGQGIDGAIKGEPAAGDLQRCPASSSALARPDGLPDVALACLGPGPDVRLAGLRGRPLVVNVWASWCLPCRAELAILGQVATEAGPLVQFLGIDINDPDSGSALALLAASGVRYPSVIDPEQASRAGLRYLGPPVTLFVRADGTIAKRELGAISSAEELRKLIETSLGVQVPG